MRRRDVAWRLAGVAVFAVAVAIGLGDWVGDGVKLLAFALALVGIVLTVQGRRVPAAWRAELSKHRALAPTIHALRRRSGRTGH